MKCQSCDQAAIHHVTEIVAGNPVEFHVCDAHLKELDNLQPASQADKPAGGLVAFWTDPKLCEALADPVARQQLAARLLPALCLALLDRQPEVRILAACCLTLLGPDGRSAIGALRDALKDPDERVRKAAQIALDYLQSDPPSWLI